MAKVSDSRGSTYKDLVFLGLESRGSRLDRNFDISLI